MIILSGIEFTYELGENYGKADITATESKRKHSDTGLWAEQREKPN
jgi:hypothetical protein